MQEGIPDSSQSTPADVMGPLQQSLVERPTLRASDPQAEPPHCGHSATQHPPSFSRPARPLLLHIESDGSGRKEADQTQREIGYCIQVTCEWTAPKPRWHNCTKSLSFHVLHLSICSFKTSQVQYLVVAFLWFVPSSPSVRCFIGRGIRNKSNQQTN